MTIPVTIPPQTDSLPAGHIRITRENSLTNEVATIYEGPSQHSFAGQDLSYCTVIGDTLIGTDFATTDLEGANLSGLIFDRVNFEQANLYEARLTNTEFLRCILRRTSLRRADISAARFDRYSAYYRTDFRRTNAAEARFERWADLSTCLGIRRCGAQEVGCTVVDLRINMSDTVDCSWVCPDHASRITTCPDCGEEVFDELSHQDTDHSNYDEDYPRAGVIHSYSYKPRWTVHGEDSPVVMGFELEVDARHSLANNVGQHADEDLLIVKEDCSVDGFEIVSHPMTLGWAKANFPAAPLLTDLANNGATSHDRASLHIHVSRDGFTNHEHRMAWLLFIHRNQDAVRALSRRSEAALSSWAAFEAPAHRDYPDLEAKATNSRGHYWRRTSAVNCCLPSTFELRTFCSTLDLTEFWAALEFVDSSVEYTRHIGTDQLMLGIEPFRSFVTANERYTNLATEMESRLPR